MSQSVEQVVEEFVALLLLIGAALLLCRRWYKKGTAAQQKQGKGTCLGPAEAAEQKKALTRTMSAAAEFGDRDVEMSPARGGVQEVGAHLAELKLQKYRADFERHGYDDWQKILTMSEKQLAVMFVMVRMPPKDAKLLRDRIMQQLAET
uniref:SAM domain-containing protein n=1 Tax=Calcidiscus leptoporus TaxID=127549 RepID=A0A7S0P6M8_9EUKA|mmetsp:Transcript_946/g.2172  ORF Transcript_946/g.2172 Transcript_946/m.2172 type:complete len:149 (+) Transcript_946:97-543(+)